ncbi:Sodium:dicarboxylate symporter [Blastocladiella britannica]|nr:Sodium:dicarboxylate symporter [Blastocladiella britannica]
MNAWQFLRTKTNLTHWILVGMVIGILIGGLAPGKTTIQIGGYFTTIFLRSVKALIAPLIFSTLYVGIAGHKTDAATVGRLFIKSIFYFEVVSTIALFLGLFAANIFNPGSGMTLMPGKLDQSIIDGESKVQGSSLIDSEIISIFPQSFYEAAANGLTLQVVVCAIFFGIASLWVKDEQRKPMVSFMESMSLIMFQVTNIVMMLAPLGVCGALMKSISQYGFKVLATAGSLVGLLLGTLIVFVICVLIPIILLARIPALEFFNKIREPVTLAFFTASSESALPIAIENLIEFGVPKDIVAFVIATGYSFNLDGSTLYLAIASRFCAQIGGVEQSFGDQILMMITLMLTTKGIAAVPRASLLVLAAACSQFHLPIEAILVILTVDTFMDMMRTSVNVTGNCIACVIISKWEGRFREDYTPTASIEDLEKSVVAPHDIEASVVPTESTATTAADVVPHTA